MLAILLALASLSHPVAFGGQGAYEVRHVEMTAGPFGVWANTTFDVEGSDAFDLRGAIEATDGSWDPEIEPSELEAFHRQNSGHGRFEGPECQSALSWARIDGQLPTGVGRFSFRVPDALGPSASVSPLRVVFSILAVGLPNASTGGFFLEPKEFSPSRIAAECGFFQGPTNPFSYQGEAMVAETWSIAFAMPWQARPDSIQPASLAPRWDGKAIRVEHREDRSTLFFDGVRVGWETPAPDITELDSTPQGLGRPLVGLAWAMGALVAILLRSRLSLWFAFLLGGFTRVTVESSLEHPRRSRILAFVQENPGASVADLERETGLKHGVLLYHVAVLTRLGLVVRERDGFRTRHFAKGSARPQAPFRSPIQSRLLDLLRSHPGASQEELMRVADISRSIAQYNLACLHRAGSLEQRVDGRYRRYFLA